MIVGQNHKVTDCSGFAHFHGFLPQPTSVAVGGVGVGVGGVICYQRC